MATKEDLDALVELGKEISDEEKRNRHLAILKEIAERIDVVLDIQANEESTKAQDSQENEEEERRIQEEKRLEEERRAQEEKKALAEKRANEERAKVQAEQRRKEKEQNEREAKEKEAKELEAKELENKNSFRRSSFRKSLNLSGTGNSLEEVQARIPKPTGRGVDITDISVAKTYVDVRDDNNPTDWMILRYDGQTNKIKVTESGAGGFQEFQSKLVEEPLYGYFRYTFGDTQRTKFIFVSYVPDKLNGLKKAKIASHKPEVAAFLKYFHVEINALSRDSISVHNLESKLRSAGGADYGSGRGGGTNGGENFGGIKANAASFYAKTEKESKVEIVYHKGPLSTTPVDLTGRPTVASATEARKNMIDLNA